jgi:hypothetical protein
MSNPKTLSFDWVFWLQWVLVGTLGWFLGLALIGDVGIGAAMGIMQWLVLRPQVRQASWWIVASIVGWIIGLVAIAVVPPEIGALTGIMLGVVFGTAQWFILRRWVDGAGWWIVVSALGWAVGPIFGVLFVGAVVGAVTGIALELLLRHPRPEM